MTFNNSTDDSNDDTMIYYGRILCMGIFSMSAISLLIPYIVVDRVKDTMLGKLMKSYCCLSLLAVLAHFVYTLMEFAIETSNAICGLIIYISLFCYFASLISRVLFVFHICYIFYNSYKMILKDVTDEQLQKLRTGYLLSMCGVPFLLITGIAVRNFVLDVRLQKEDSAYCLNYGDNDRFTFFVLAVAIVLIQVIGFGIILVLSYLLYKAHKVQKNVGQDSLNLLRIALGIGAAYGVTWIVYAFRPLYNSVASMVLYSGGTLDSILIISVFFYSNKALTRIKLCISTVKCKTSEV